MQLSKEADKKQDKYSKWLLERNKFDTDMSYNRFLYAAKFARQINHSIKLGFIVFDADFEIQDTLSFSDHYEDPTIGYYIDGALFEIIDFSYDSDSGAIHVDNTKKEIKKIFSAYSLVDPGHIHKIRLDEPEKATAGDNE